MSKPNTFETDFLKILFNATALANVWDNAASSPITSIYNGMHTGDPGETGDQTTSECAYTSYGRVAVARNSGGWTVGTGTVSPVASITFPECTGGTETWTHWGVGKASSGSGYLFYSGGVSPTRAISSGITPYLKTASTVTED